MSNGRNNAVPIWVSNGISTIEVANAIGNLNMLKTKVDSDTGMLIDNLIADLKTYTKHEISTSNVCREVSEV